MIVVQVGLALLVAGGLAVGVWLGATVLWDRPALLARAGRAEGHVAALDATLAITRAQYDTERELWAAALSETEGTRP